MKHTANQSLPPAPGKSADQLRTEFENNPPCEFAAEDYYKVYSEWLEGKVAAQGKREVYQFIKASERLPDNGWEGVVQWTDSAAYAYMEEDSLFYHGNIYDRGASFDNQPIEWLELQTQAPALPVPDAAKEAVGYSQENMYKAFMQGQEWLEKDNSINLFNEFISTF